MKSKNVPVVHGGYIDSVNYKKLIELEASKPVQEPNDKEKAKVYVKGNKKV